MGITKKLLLLICIINLHTIKAQSFATLDVSQVFSTFKFVDSNNKIDKSYSSNITNAYNLGYLYSHQKGILIGINIGLRKAGASKEITGVHFSWNLQYVEAKLGVGYMLNKWRLKPYILLSPYYSSLLKATETIGEQSYDIKQDKALAKYDFGVMASGGVHLKLSDFVSLYSCYNQIVGTKNIEGTNNQKLYNHGFSISLGIALTITKSSPKWIQ